MRSKNASAAVFALDQRLAIRSGPLVEVERAVRLHARPRRLAPSAEARGAKSLRGAHGGIDDVVEDPGEVVVKAGGAHQNDEAPDRVETDATEPPVPVDGGERGHRRGVRAQDVHARPQRPGVHRRRILDGGVSLARCHVAHYSSRCRGTLPARRSAGSAGTCRSDRRSWLTCTSADATRIVP